MTEPIGKPSPSLIRGALALMAVLAVLQFSLVNVEKYYTKADEGVYLRYALAVKDGGMGEFKTLMEDYTRNPEQWIYPSPVRIGHIQLGAWSLNLLWGDDAKKGYDALACLSALCHVLLLPLVFIWVFRMFRSPMLSMAALLLVGTSPLQLAMGRRAMQDGVFNLFAMVALWLFFENMQKECKWLKGMFAVAVALSLLMKETALLLYLFYIAYLVLDRLLKKRDRVFYVRMGITLAASLGLYALVMFLASGDLGLVYTVVKSAHSTEWNPYAVEYMSGPWYRYLIDFFILSPVIVMLAIGHMGAVIFRRVRDDASRFFVLYILVCFILFSFFAKNVRLMIMVEFPLILCGLVMLKTLLEKNFEHPKKLLAAFTAVVVLVAALNLLEFRKLFLVNKIYDPVSFHLYQVHEMIPRKR